MNFEVIQALEELERERGVSKEILLEALEAALVSAFKRHYGSTQNVRVDLDGDAGQLGSLPRRPLSRRSPTRKQKSHWMRQERSVLPTI